MICRLHVLERLEPNIVSALGKVERVPRPSWALAFSGRLLHEFELNKHLGICTTIGKMEITTAVGIGYCDYLGTRAK